MEEYTTISAHFAHYRISDWTLGIVESQQLSFDNLDLPPNLVKGPRTLLSDDIERCG
jgi:hypothetical protein